MIQTVTQETSENSRNRISSRKAEDGDELSQLKRDLLQAELRVAKARANLACAEADVKVLGSRLRAFTR
jgi:hypothetical protein